MADTDAQVIDKLKTQRDQLISRLLEVSGSPQVDYTVTTKNGGETITRSAYVKLLNDQLEQTLMLLQQLQPFIVNTRVYV